MMGKFGFICLLIGGALLIITGQTLTLNPATQVTLINLINTYVTPHIGITGETIVTVYVLATSLGGIGVIVGAIIWYAVGYGCGASIGKLIVSLSTGAATFVVVMEFYFAWQAGVFSLPLHEIITHFTGLGLTFAAVFVVLLGTIIGAGRKRPPKVVTEPGPEPEYTP